MYRTLNWHSASRTPFTILVFLAILAVLLPVVPVYAAGQWDTQFGLAGLADAAPNGTLWEFWLDGTDLYVVGEFTQIGGVTANHIAKWDGSQWSDVGGAFFSNTHSYTSVYTIVGHKGDIVVAGEFTGVNGNSGDVAVWDGASWSTVPGFWLYKGANDDITSLSSDGSSLYIGGRFNEKVVEWDDTTMTSLVSSWTGSVSAPVYAIHSFGGNLYAGGIFDSFNGVAMTNVGRWDGNQWNATPPGLESAVTELFDHDGSVYAGVAAGSHSYPNRSINRWTGSQWVPEVTWNSGSNCAWGLYDALFFNGEVYQTGVYFNYEISERLYDVARWHNGSWDDMEGGIAGTGGQCKGAGPLFEYDGRLLVGGSFSAAGGMPVTNLVEWTGAGWYTFGPDDRVTALETANGDVYLGGEFLSAHDAPASRIAKWDGTTWSALGTGLDGGVKDIQAIGTDIYVAGDFADAGGSGAADLARWDGTSWHSLGASPQLGTIEALGSDGTNLYAAGSFLLIGGGVAKRVAMWDGSNWSALGDGVADGTVNALAYDGTTLYAAGDFIQAGSSIVGNIAAWDGSSWAAMDGGFDAPVYSLAIHLGSVFAGGEMNNANAASFLNNIARWNGTGWETLTDAGTNGVNAPVRTLTSAGLELYAGGDFTSAGTSTVAHVASWNGTSWDDVGGGTDAPVDAIASDGSDVFAGGDFVTAGGETSHKFARWSILATGADTPALEATTVLEPPFPNPFNPSTTLRYRLARGGSVTITVYSVDGRRVRTLVDEVQPPVGFRSVVWDGTDDTGHSVSSGVYYIMMRAAGETRSHKLVLLK